MSNGHPRVAGGGSGGPGPLTKLLAFVVGIITLAGALLFSVVLFVVLAAVGLIAGAYLWWQTRELRGQLREEMRKAAERRPGGPMGPGAPGGAYDDNVIDGDYVREARRADGRDGGTSDPDDERPNGRR